jgi:hypothetical protein
MADDKVKKPDKRRRPLWRRLTRWFVITAIVLVVLLIPARLALPSVLRWYVNRTINQSVLYAGEIGDIDVHLWRGAYTIKDIRINKVTGNVPVPLFAARQVDLAVQWEALRHGKVVGRIRMQEPELNFVDSGDKSTSQTGTGGPWLQIIKDLFPFKINRAQIDNGAIHFRAIDTNPPVDVYMSHLQASIENLTNIGGEVTPLISTVTATALVMDHARFEYQMKFDPFSYYPTFELRVRLLGLDVTKTNQLARAYAAFDFEKGWFDLVMEMECREGQLQGYIKPLFRNLQILSLEKDIKQDNVLQFFWEALAGITEELLKNQRRDQFGTVIPLRGDLSRPQTDILVTLGGVLRNAFIRAYLPKLRGGMTPELEGLEFGKGTDSITDPKSIGND